jgi:hypothetical protein
VGRALLVDAAIKPINQICCLYPKRFADSQESPYRNWPASLYLLPVAGGKSVTDHVFLRVALPLPQFFDPNSQSTEELLFVNHPAYLENMGKDHHEQISCKDGKPLFGITY